MASAPHDRQKRLDAKQALLRPPVLFTGLQARAVGEGFAESFQKGKVTVWACSILPDHVHLVIARHSRTVEELIEFAKRAATLQLVAQRLHPFQDQKDRRGRLPCCWAAKCWKVFLNSAKDIERAIRYVENNPVKEGKPRQRWAFVARPTMADLM